MFFARRSLLILAAGLAISACGDADDPTKNGNNTDPNNVTNPNNSNNESNNGTVVDPNNTTIDPNNPTNNNTTEPNNPPIECEVLENFYGQIGGTGDAGGGAPTMEALDYDANLQAVYDSVPTTQDDTETEDVDEGRADDLTIQVTGALVTSTYGGNVSNTRFFLQDQNTAIRVFLDQGEQQATPIKVGQRLSFTVTSTRNFSGTPQIAKISDLVVDEEGANVPYAEATGTDLTIEQFDRIVRVFGTIESDNGECGGGNKCYTFNHGDKTTTLRSRSEFLTVGGCYTYVGPVGAFPGPLATGDKTIQLDSVNFDWLFELR